RCGTCTNELYKKIEPITMLKLQPDDYEANCCIQPYGTSSMLLNESKKDGMNISRSFHLGMNLNPNY
ncbi:hypothetical protein Hamer_G032234, partial [Homarus americanus]